MGTRSRIGIQLVDESILSVYCHYDGYPEFNGVKLVEHFNSRDAVTELIDGGDMSSCWTKDRWTEDRWGAYPTTAQEYGPQYYSHRGEDCPPRLDANKYDYLADGEEYAYIYTLNDEWVCYDLHETPKIVAIPAPVAA